jgi:hypothetical protein
MKIVGALVVIVLGLGIAGYVLLKRSDGTEGPLPGGPLRSGALVTTDVDWTDVLGDKGACHGGDCAPMAPIELQLVDPAWTRVTGIMVHDGELYVPCDLGFMWGRFSGQRRWVLNAIYVFKRWHEDAVRDGRVVLRIDGKRYERQAVRVNDPALVAALKAQLEDMARQWVAPEPLGPAPTDGPNDIWFFRIDPRPTTASTADNPAQPIGGSTS